MWVVRYGSSFVHRAEDSEYHIEYDQFMPDNFLINHQDKCYKSTCIFITHLPSYNCTFTITLESVLIDERCLYWR